MNPEIHELNPERLTPLVRFLDDAKSEPNPRWTYVESVGSDWMLTVSPDNPREVIAVRTSEIGTIDSFSIDVDQPDNFDHIQIDSSTGLLDVVSNIDAQIDMGLTTPNSDEIQLFCELLDTLELLQSI